MFISLLVTYFFLQIVVCNIVDCLDTFKISIFINFRINTINYFCR